MANQNCRNCNHPLSDKDKYCSGCGQKNTDGRISIGSFFSAFFSTVFNLESKFFQTIGHSFIPGKLTVEYFNGKHKRYFHPVRFFIVTALLLIAAIGLRTTEIDMSFGDYGERSEKLVSKKMFLGDMQTAADETLGKFPNQDSLKSAFDTLYQSLAGTNLNKQDSLDLSRAIIAGGIDNIQFKISAEDFVNLSTPEIIDKYRVEGRIDRLILKQKLKLMKDKGSFGPFVLGNSLWMILLMMPVLALILKLLYIRHNYYYVEHLVFSFHTHAFTFLLLIIMVLISNLDPPTWTIAIGLGTLFIYLYLALRKVYNQGWLKSLVKLLATNFVYFFLFLFFFAFGLLTSIAIF